VLLSDFHKRALLAMLGYKEGAVITDARFLPDIDGVKISVLGEKVEDDTNPVRRLANLLSALPCVEEASGDFPDLVI